MEKISLIYVLPLLSLIIILIRLPEIDRWLRNQYSNAPFLITLILGGSTILTHVITVVAPLKKYERQENNKWTIIDNLIATYLDHEIFRGSPLVANIMIPRRVFYCTREPVIGSSVFRRISARFFVRRLDVVWLSPGNMMNKQFRITARQGITGKAYTIGRTIIRDIPGSIDQLNFTEQQRATISGNGFVASTPIFAFDRKYSRSTQKIVGIVTFSSSIPGSEKIIESERNREILKENITEFSGICSLIL
ncbi:hypothetical protein [Terrimonas ferruginea]|uniref:hypothetical protein n=1 Tax=Terrimonas ferruginea TaxID=249 RepID=UPI0003FE37F8|nr:hypothetical protein [Terrimonas ferruginea]